MGTEALDQFVPNRYKVKGQVKASFKTIPSVILSQKPSNLANDADHQLEEVIAQFTDLENKGKVNVTRGCATILRGSLASFGVEEIAVRDLYLNPNRKIHVVDTCDEVVAEPGEVVLSAGFYGCQAILAEVGNRLVFKHNLEPCLDFGIQFLERIKNCTGFINEVTILAKQKSDLNYLAQGAVELGIDSQKVRIGLVHQDPFRFWAVTQHSAEKFDQRDTAIAITTELSPRTKLPVLMTNYR